MAEKLTREEINSLLSSISGDKDNSKKRRKLYKEFLDNSTSFNSKIIMELIEMEMKKRQDEGHEISLKYMKREIPEEYARKRMKECGSGLWWGGESEWYIVGVKNLGVNKTEKGSFQIRAVCNMEYISSHIVYGENEPVQQEAKISMNISDKFKTEEFIFLWT